LEKGGTLDDYRTKYSRDDILKLNAVLDMEASWQLGMEGIREE
jgi:hypothetical protein